MVDVYNLKDMWGAVLFRGIVAILFGIAAVFWPGLTLVVLVYLFSVYVIATGVVNLVTSLTNFGRLNTGWGRVLLLVLGAGEIGVGVYLLRHPHITFATLILILGLTLVVRGVFEVVFGLFGEGSGLYKTVAVIGGLLAAIAGVIVLVQPVAGGVAFVWVLGLYALITGPMLVALAFEAKNAVLPAGARRARTA